jgi:TolB-like protein/DNA-binding SARP family transcriptional activator/Tfp pilus assembly protein PilF
MERPKRIYLRLLGPFAAGTEADATVRISISSKKSRALLAFLAMHPDRGASREELATLLWGDRSDLHARHNLRQALYAMRAELAMVAPDSLNIGTERVGIRPECFAVDALEFSALTESSELADLEHAVSLYRGRFLADFSLELEPFDEWVRAERSRLEAKAANAFEICAVRQDIGGNGQKAIEFALRLIELDPLREDWQRLLLRLYEKYRGGDAAIAHARDLAALLRRDLGVEPAPATKALVAEIERRASAQVCSIAGPSALTAEAINRAPATPSLAPSRAGEARHRSSIAHGRFAKPAIVVLPLANLGRDTERDCFAEGLAIDLVTALSCVKSLSIIAGDASLTCKGRPVDVRRIGRDLKVGYVLQVSVRKAENRVRVAAQLVAAGTGNHIWAQRYDRELSDVFAVQDEIAAKVAAAVEPHVYAAEGIRASRKPPHTLGASGCVMRALALVNTRSKQNYAAAEDLLKRAIEIDPACAQAYSLFAYVTALNVVYGWKPREHNMAIAREAAHNAVLLDVDNPWAHLALGFVHAQSQSPEEAIREAETAIALNPSFGLAHTYLGAALSHLGRTEQALARIDTAERLCPREMFFGVNNYVRANAYFAAERHREARIFARRSVEESPGIVTSHRQLIVNSTLAGDIPEAKVALKALLRLVPGTSLRSIDEALPYAREKDRTRFLDAFRRVGVQ